MSHVAGRCHPFCPCEEPGFRVPWLLCQAWVLQGCSKPSQPLPSEQSPREEGSVATHLSRPSLHAPHRPAAGYPADKAPSMLHPSFWNSRTMTLSQGSGRGGGRPACRAPEFPSPRHCPSLPAVPKEWRDLLPAPLAPQPPTEPGVLSFTRFSLSYTKQPLCVMLESWSPRSPSCSATTAADLQWTNCAPQGPVCPSHAMTVSSTCPALPDENPTLSRH